MIGSNIFDFFESQAVIQQLSNNPVKFDRSKRYDMDIAITEYVDPGFISVSIECLFYEDNTGGQIRFFNLDKHQSEFVNKIIDTYPLRNFKLRTSTTVYIDCAEQEGVALKMIADLYAIDEIAI